MPINFAIKLAATVAIEALQVGLQASKRTFGPRLDELTVTTADYGTPLPRFLGERRFACPVFHAEDLKEVENTTKVKGGGKQTTYSYLATFACAIADNAIDKVLKIFFDDKLIYDATGTGPISYASSLHIDLNKVMRIYLGTEDQLPDPRYVTFCEDKYGPDSAPAYRGVSYLFFEELPVDNFGNRIPQIQVIATAAAADTHPFENLTTTQSSSADFAFSPGGGWMAHWSNTGGGLDWWDVPTRTFIGRSPNANTMTGGIGGISLDKSGTAWFVGTILVPSDAWLFQVPPVGPPTKTLTNAASLFLGQSRAFDLADGTVQVLTCYSTSAPTAGYLDGTAHVATAESGREWCIDDNGDIWMASHPMGSSSTLTLTNMMTGASAVIATASRSNPKTVRMTYVESEGHFFINSDAHYYIVPRDTLTLSASGVQGWSGDAKLRPAMPSMISFWDRFSEYSLADGSLIRALNPNDWVTASYAEEAFDPVNYAIWARTGGTIRVCYIDRASNSGTTLGAIVSKMCDAAGMADRDTSALTQAVAGYSWTRGDVKSQMEPVLDIHDVDARPHDWTIEFLPRGGAPSDTILTQDFAKSGDGPRYKVTIGQDTDFPRLLRVNFADTGFDQQTNNVLSPLPIDSVDSQRDDTIDLTTYADTPDGAQQKADRYMRRQWNSRESIENALTAQYLALEPGDVKALSLDGIVHNARLIKQTIAGGRIDCTFVRDETTFAAINSATTGPPMDSRDHEVITIPSPIRGFVIDAPYREDGDEDVRPLLYAAAGSYGGLTYPGAVIYEATGTGTSLAYDQLFDTVPGGATWGICSGTLANADANLWDRGNTLPVKLQSGSLTSVAEADIDADPTLNLILVGSTGAWEYVNFTTATLNGDGSYTLSGFKRGRRGTEWMCASHTSGEAFILASSLDVEEMGTDQVSGSLSFKAQSIGRPLDTAPVIDVAPYTGATLKPYAPARIKWTTDGTDMFGEIIRRTRVGGAWVGGSTIPLSENSEAYEVDIYHSTTFKRTISVSGTNTFTYTAAQISADSNTVGVAPPSNVYQLSDAVGRGFALAA